LTGSAADNFLCGDFGHDSISGLRGNDTLYGAELNDTLIGGRGMDVLSGGSGSDDFVFNAARESSALASDTIIAGFRATGFDGAGIAGGDRIILSGIDADAGVAGNQAFTFGGAGAGQLRVVAFGTNSVVLGNTDGDAAAEFRLVIEDGGVLASAYTAGDFVL
jgi:Ca2+-binding RTX toxin-like protein